MIYRIQLNIYVQLSIDNESLHNVVKYCKTLDGAKVNISSDFDFLRNFSLTKSVFFYIRFA